MVGARNPAPPLAGYAAQSRKARCKKQPERRARLFLCPPRRRTGGEWLEPATLPYPQQAMPRNRAKRDAKNSRSAERGCSFVLPAAEQAANGWSPQPCPPLAGYAAQSRSDAQTALIPKTQPAAPYAAETSRYVPPLYTYPTKFMHNLCHIVM